MNAKDVRWPVPADLQPWVEGIEVTTHEKDLRCPLVHVPDPATVLVWRIAADGCGAVFVMGPRTHASYFDAKDVPLCLRLRFRPGAAPALVGVSAGEIVDRVVPLDDLWGRSAHRLAEELAERADRPALAVEHLAAALRLRAGTTRVPPRADNLVRTAAAALSVASGRPPARVGEVARRAGVGERQLRTLFTTAVGVSPKQFARLSRIRSVVAGAAREPWARLANDAGYYDQSHMTAEFREVMHVTPGAFVRGSFPTVPC
ncbi:helix-turn-helix domain-containing protein [Pseudonocardia sp. CA-142604]|uniref:helix-turn-helix domain-containing protein n=1 Tax=Pseudonocardia sp. CA-142604 TaxID=3240024 RepID=UPI003D8B80DE